MSVNKDDIVRINYHVLFILKFEIISQFYLSDNKKIKIIYIYIYI